MPTKEAKKSSKTKTSSSKKDPSSSSGKEKKKKSSKRTKSRSPSRARKAADDEGQPADSTNTTSTTPPPPLPPPPSASEGPKASSDFEAGLLFQRFARNGGVDAKDFQRMWREMDKTTASRAGEGGEGVIETGRHRADEGSQERRGERGQDGLGPANKFEFGQLFQKYDSDGDGKLGRADFERMIGGALRLGGTYGAAADEGDNGGSRNGGINGAVGAVGARPGDIGGAGSGENGPVVAKAVPTAVRDLTSSAAGGRSITHYDETTGVPLTREAVESQLSLGHTVVLLSEAYNRRLSRLQALASSRLMPVREQLLQLRRRFHSRADEVKAAKAAVERETLADAGAILERLRSAEVLKQATLAQGVNGVTAELEGVEKLAEQVAGVTSLATTAGFASTSPGYAHNFEGTEKMVELIQSYPELCNSIDRVANKPFDPNIEVRADDFPHETAERLEVLRRADRYEQALGVKDQMLWNVLQETKGLEDKCEEERALGQEFAEEAQEWVALAARLSDNVGILKTEAVQMSQLQEENILLLRENQELTRRLDALERGR